MDRRELLFGGAAVLAGIALPDVLRKDPKKCVLWVVFLGAYPLNKATYRDNKAIERAAKRFGFEVLDTIHEVKSYSRILCRLECGLAWARKQERLILNERMLDSDVGHISVGIKAMWIEV